MAWQGGTPLRPVEVHRRGRAVTHGAVGRRRRPRLSHGRRLRNGLQIPASSLLPGGVARAEVRLSVGVASVDLVQPPVLPGADAVEAGVAGLRGDQRLGGGGASGGRGVSGQRGHGVRLRLREGQPVVRAVGTAAEPAVQLAEGEVPEEALGLPQGATGGLGRERRRRSGRRRSKTPSEQRRYFKDATRLWVVV